MNTESTQLLKNPELYPDERYLEEILNTGLFNTYLALIRQLTDSGLAWEWRYYNDGKAWLCKVSFKKKTVAWVSLWENFIKVGFYFTEKNRDGIINLEINQSYKDSFTSAKPIGKLIPLIVAIDASESLKTFEIISKYKMLTL
jgi:hypothetical protein